MKYKVQNNIVVDERKLNILLRLGCPEHIIFAKICGKKVRSSGDKLIDETLECLVSRKRYNNWGGNHNPQGKNQYNKRGQVDHQVDHQVDQPKTGQLGTLTSTNTITSVNTNSRNNSSLVSTARASNKFIPPTIDEVKAYAKQQNDMAGVGGFACTEQIAQDFYDYYAGIGWMLPNDSRTPIVDWRPFLSKWARDSHRFQKTTQPRSRKRDINDPNNFII